MPSLESTSIRATAKPVDSLDEQLPLDRQPSQCTSSEAHGYQRAGVGQSGIGPSAYQDRHLPALEAIAWRLRRACAHAPQVWAPQVSRPT